MVLFWSLFRKNTQTVAQSIYQACKGTRDFQTIQIGNTLQTGTFYDNATNNLGRRTKHKLLKPVELLQTGPRGDYNATVTMTSQNRLQISHWNWQVLMKSGEDNLKCLWAQNERRKPSEGRGHRQERQSVENRCHNLHILKRQTALV